MTQAICFKCGSLKIGAFGQCKQCGELPKSDEDLIMSIALTDHYLDLNTLLEIGKSIKAGERPNLDDATRKDLIAVLEQFKQTPEGKSFL